jgi:hypothetical protein
VTREFHVGDSPQAPPVPPVPPEQAPPFKAPFSDDAANRKLATATASRQADRGFSAFLQTELPRQVCAWRDHGVVRQAIEFTPSWDAERGVFIVGVYFHFGSDPLWATLQRHAPRWSAAIEGNRRDLGPARGNFYAHANELFEDARGSLWKDTFAYVAPQDLDSWAARCNDWLDRSAMPKLDAAGDLPGLARFLFTDYRRRRIEPAQWSMDAMVTTLFLLRLPRADHAHEATWWPSLEGHARKDLHYPLQRKAEDPERIYAEELLAAIERLRDPRKEA